MPVEPEPDQPAPARADSRVAVEQRGPVVEVRVGSGTKGNALTSEDWSDLARVFEQLGRRDPETADQPGQTPSVVLVRGAGETFSAGSDLREWAAADPESVADSFARMETALRAIEQCPIPVIAAVDGVAAGAGCQLALACDLQVLTSRARIGMPIARLGILVSADFAARISVLAGPAVTRDLLYTGRLMTAEEANRVGLATRCVPVEEWEAAISELLDTIVRQPVAAHRATKRAVSAILEPTRNAAHAATGSPVEFGHFRAGVSAFLAGSGSDNQ